MNFDKTVNSILNFLVTENIVDGVAILPGGFKPPHKGHFEALKHIINENQASAAIVYIGKPDRDGITADQSKQIWDIYANYINVPVTAIISEVTPVKSVYEYADENKNIPLFVGAGEEDMKRYAWFEKNKDDFPLVNLVPIPPQFGRISGTETRKNLSDTNWIPDQALEKVHDIKSILNI